ncbi:unnamed protein product, partial [Schistosoma intercalatum]
YALGPSPWIREWSTNGLTNLSLFSCRMYKSNQVVLLDFVLKHLQIYMIY